MKVSLTPFLKVSLTPFLWPFFEYKQFALG